MSIRKISELTPSKAFDRLRKQKVKIAVRDLQTKLSAEVKKVNYAVQFWHGTEGITWYMAKNNLDAEKLQQDFEKDNLQPYSTAEETDEVKEKVWAATAAYHQALEEILKDYS